MLWLVVGAMMLGMLALTVYAFSAAFSAARDVSRSVTGGPADALRSLGFQIQRVDVAGGQAAGMWHGMAATVGWATHAPSGGSGFDEVHFRTSISVAMRPSLGLGLDAVETRGAAPLGDPRLDGRLALSPHAAPAARARLVHAAPMVAPALGRGTLRLADHGVSLELPHIVSTAIDLQAHLDGVTSIAHALRAS